MPAERAKATFEDPRVKTFLRVAKDDFGGSCTLPANENTEAKLRSSGSGDFSSSFYEVDIPCSGKVASIHITAEFSPPLGTPLNLVLALHLNR